MSRSNSRVGSIINPLDNELAAVVRYITSTVPPPYGVENQMLFVAKDSSGNDVKLFYVYKNGEWKPLFPLQHEFLSGELINDITQNIRFVRAYDHNDGLLEGKIGESQNYLTIVGDEHHKMEVDADRNEIKINLSNVTKDKLDSSLVGQIDSSIQRVVINGVETKGTLVVNDSEGITASANLSGVDADGNALANDEIVLDINQVKESKLEPSLQQKINSGLQQVYTTDVLGNASSSASGPTVVFRSNQDHITIVSGSFDGSGVDVADELYFDINRVPREKLDDDILDSLNSAIQKFYVRDASDNILHEAVGPDVTLSSLDGTVRIETVQNQYGVDNIRFDVQDVPYHKLDSGTRDIVDKAFTTVSVHTDGNPAYPKSFQGRNIKITHDDEIDVIADEALGEVYFTLTNVPQSKLDSEIVTKAQSALQQIRVNNVDVLSQPNVNLTTGAEITTTSDVPSNSIHLDLGVVPESKIDPALVSKVQSALQEVSLVTGEKVSGARMFVDSNDWITLDVNEVTNTLSIHGTNKVRVSDVLPSASAHEDGDIVMVTSTSPPTWYSLYNSTWTSIVPSWVKQDASEIHLSEFGGTLDASRINHFPQSDFSQTDVNDKSYIKNKPSWIQDQQVDVSMNLFGGNLEWDRISQVPDSFVAHRLKVSSGSFPDAPSKGSVTFREDLGKAYVYDGASWSTIENTVATRITTLDGSFPSSPVHGQLVFRIDEGKTYVYSGTEWDPIGEGFQWIRETQTEMKLIDFGGDLPWSRIDGDTVPDFFPTDKVQGGAILPLDASGVKGNVWYKTDVNALYVHNGTTWVRYQEYISWLDASQSQVQLSSFGGKVSYSSQIDGTPDLSVYTETSNMVQFIKDHQHQVNIADFASTLPWDKVSSKPTWIDPSQVRVTLSEFGGSLDHSRLSNVPVPNWSQTDSTNKSFIANKPQWIAPVQSNVLLSGFGGQVNFDTQVDRPSWLSTVQGEIPVAGFKGDLPYSRVSGRPQSIHDLADNTLFVKTTGVTGDGMVDVSKNDVNKTLHFSLHHVPWSKLESSSIPTYFDTASVRRGTTKPSTNVGEGDVFYKTTTDANGDQGLYVHNGSTWIEMARERTWFEEDASSVPLSSLGGTLPSSRITGQIQVSATTPTSAHDGMLWRNTADETLHVYYQGQWFATGTAWLTPMQSGVNVSGFTNDAGYIDAATAKAAVIDDVKVSDLSGNFSFSRLDDLPPSLSDLVGSDKYMLIENIGSDATIDVAVDSSNVTLSVTSIDWDTQVHGKPSTFTTQNIQTYATLADVSNPVRGQVVYDITSNAIHYRTNTEWIELEKVHSWMDASQENIMLEGFKGTIDASRVVHRVVASDTQPSSGYDGQLWWSNSTSSMSVYHDGIWYPIGSDWALGDQSSVQLSLFNNDAGFVDSLGAITAVKNNVQKSELTGTIDYHTEIHNQPTKASDLVQDLSYLKNVNLTVDSTLIKTDVSTDASNAQVRLGVNTIPWSKIDDVPDDFVTYQVRTSPDLTSIVSPAIGEVVYKTDDKKLYIFSGSTDGWVAMGNEVSWIKPTQSDVALESFGGDLDASRVKHQVSVSSTEPTSPHLGLLWQHPTEQALRIWVGDDWELLSAPWFEVDASNINVSSFTNDVNYLKESELKTSIQSQLVKTDISGSIPVSDISGNIPWNKIDNRPVNLSDLVDDTDLLLPSNVQGDDLVTVNATSKGAQLSINNVPWNRLDSSTIPTSFEADRVTRGTTLPTDQLDEGDLFYLTQDTANESEGLYVHDGAGWSQVGTHVDWVDASQSSVQIASFGGTIPLNRVSGRIIQQDTNPGAITPEGAAYPGMLWLNTSNNVLYVYGTNTQWVPAVSAWATKKDPSEVDLSTFNNSVSSFVDASGSIHAVKEHVKIYDLSGNLPYQKITNGPTALSEFTNDQNFLQSVDIDVSGSLLTVTRGDKSATIELSVVPWNSVSSKPDYFPTNKVRSGTSLPQDDISEGDLFYHTSEDYVYYHNGSVWKRIGDRLDWLDASQANVSLSSFGGNLDASRIDRRMIASAEYPNNPYSGMLWKKNDGSIHVYDGTSFELIHAPWVDVSQNQINISAFVNDSSFATTNEVDLKLADIQFDDVSGSLSWSRLDSSKPSTLSFFQNDLTLLDASNITYDGDIVVDVSGIPYSSGTPVSAHVRLEKVPWTKLENVPSKVSDTGISVDRVQSGSVLPSSGVSGDVFYDTNDKCLYVHNGESGSSAWVKLAHWYSWSAQSQSSIPIAGFANDLPASRVSGKLIETLTEPASSQRHGGLLWKDPSNNTIKVWSGSNWFTLWSSWIQDDASSIPISSFSNDASYVREQDILPKVQNAVSLEDLSGSILYQDLSGNVPTDLSDFSNTTGFIKSNQIINQDNDTSIRILQDVQTNEIKLSVNESALSSFVAQTDYDKRLRIGGDIDDQNLTNVSAGDFYYDTSNNKLSIYDGSSWVLQSIPNTDIFALKTEVPATDTFLPYTRLRVGIEVPTTNVSVGDMFYDSSNNSLLVYDSNTGWTEKIPDLSTYITDSEVNTAVSTAMSQSLSGYFTKSDVSDNYVSNTVFTNELLNYYTKSQTDSTLASFASLAYLNTEISKYTPTSVLQADYMTSAEITALFNSELSGVASTSDLEAYVRVNEFNASFDNYIPRDQLLSWLEGKQQELPLSAFQGELDFTRINNIPSWMKANPQDVNIAEFGGKLLYGDIVGAPTINDIQSDWNTSDVLAESYIRNKPSWITGLQSSIDVSKFGGIENIDFTKLHNIPSWISSSQSSVDINGFDGQLSYNSLRDRPSWIKSSQSSISLGGFKTDVRLTKTYVSPSLDTNDVGEIILNLTDQKLYFYNGTTWEKVSGDSTESGNGSGVSQGSAKMDTVSSITNASGKSMGDMVFDIETKTSYYHDGISFVKFGEIRHIDSLQADPTLVGSLAYHTPDSSLYFNKVVTGENGQVTGTQWVKVRMSGDDVHTRVTLPTTVVTPATNGDVYFDTGTNTLRVYYSGSWVEHSTGDVIPDWVKQDPSEILLSQFTDDIGFASKLEVVTSTNDKASPAVGDMVFESSTGQSYVYDGTSWNSMNASGDSVPDWVTEDPSEISLSSFTNDLTIPNVPGWVSSDPQTIPLSTFLNDLSTTTQDGSFVETAVNILSFKGNGSTLTRLKGTLTIQGAIEENAFTHYNVMLVNASTDKGVLLHQLPVGDEKSIFIDVSFFSSGDLINPLIVHVVTNETSFDGFEIYCITSKSSIVPSTFTSFGSSYGIHSGSIGDVAIDLSNNLIDTYGTITSSSPKVTNGGMILSNTTISYYERKALKAYEKVLLVSNDGVDWIVAGELTRDDGSVLLFPVIALGTYSLWCIGYRTPGKLYPSDSRYHQTITFVPNTPSARQFTAVSYNYFQTVQSPQTGYAITHDDVVHHDMNGTLITFTSIRSYAYTPYYSQHVATPYAKLIKHDSIIGRTQGAMILDGDGIGYYLDDNICTYPELFMGMYDTLIGNSESVFMYELLDDPTSPWSPSDSKNVLNLFGTSKESLIYNLFKMTYAYIKYGDAFASDLYIDSNLYTWFYDHVVQHTDELIALGHLFVSNTPGSISFSSSFFNRSNPVVSNTALNILYNSFES